MSPASRRPISSRGIDCGFSIVELLVATAVLALIMVVVVSMVSQSAALFRATRSKIDTFQEARAGFEAITRKLSQSVLNTYWDYEYPNNDPTKPPSAYVRQSELHFVSGQATNLLSGTGSNARGHAVFFQAPLGYTSVNSPAQLPNLLNACGYFIEVADDEPPNFIKNNPSRVPRYRCRLMEMVQPAEELSVYKNLLTARRNKSYGTLNDWFRTPLSPASGTTPPRYILADNIIALIISPQRSANDPVATGDPVPDLAPGYSYDSLRYQNASSPPPAVEANESALAARTRNQLPPYVQVTMVAIDEQTAARLASTQANSQVPPTFGAENLFKNQSSYASDLKILEDELIRQNVKYRVFSTSVPILQAKWSED